MLKGMQKSRKSPIIKVVLKIINIKDYMPTVNKAMQSRRLIWWNIPIDVAALLVVFAVVATPVVTAAVLFIVLLVAAAVFMVIGMPAVDVIAGLVAPGLDVIA
jgi:hypothetical protein